MDNSNFDTYIIIDGKYVNVQVQPCCGENNIVDYAIRIKDKLEFTITKHNNDQWVIAMKNADDDVDDITVQQIGTAIDKRNGA